MVKFGTMLPKLVFVKPTMLGTETSAREMLHVQVAESTTKNTMFVSVQMAKFGMEPTVLFANHAAVENNGMTLVCNVTVQQLSIGMVAHVFIAQMAKSGIHRQEPVSANQEHNGTTNSVQ